MARLYITGIYQIINVANGNFYIGSSIDIFRRKSQHFSDLKKNIHTNPKLQNAFNSYSKDSFRFYVVESCEEQEMLKIEQQYLDVVWDNGIKCYNVSKTAECNIPEGKTFNVELVSPTGEIFGPIKGLGKFARTHNLCKENLSGLIHGKFKNLQGWHLNNQKSLRPQSKLVKWSVVSPENIVYRDITNITEFAERHFLKPASLNKLLHGRRNSLFGWTKFDDKVGHHR